MLYVLDLTYYITFKIRIYRVHTSLYTLRGDTESLYEYMRALASQELNPMIIPLTFLKQYFTRLRKTLDPMLDSN